MAWSYNDYNYSKHGLQVDLDLGASGAIAIKDKYIITGGKQGPIYIADASNLGGYQPTANNSNVFQVPFIFPSKSFCSRIKPHHQSPHFVLSIQLQSKSAR